MKRRLKRILSVLSQPDILSALFKLKVVDVLQVIPDANRSIQLDEKRYSPIGDTILSTLHPKMKTLDLARPVSTISSTSFPEYSASANWLYLLLRGAFWGFVINRTKPKVLIGIDLPDELIINAQALGCFVIELYHGFGRGVTNDLYFKRYEQGLRAHPNGIIVYDQQTYDALTARLPASIQVYLARNYWIDFVEQLGAAYFEKVRYRIKSNKNQSFERTVLITLQHGYDGTRDHLEGILDNGLLAREIIDLFPAFPSIHFLIKAHPVQIMSEGWGRIEKFFLSLQQANANVQFRATIGVDVFSLLAISDGHITMSSGAIYEASLLDVPSLSLCPTMHEGGSMADAFALPEQNGLLTRGRMGSDAVEQFLTNLRPLPRERELIPSDSMESAAEIVSRVGFEGDLR